MCSECREASRCHFAYMELVEEHRVCVSSRLRCFPELLLGRVAVHGTQSEQTVYIRRHTQRNNQRGMGRGGGEGYGDWRPTVVFQSIEEKSVVVVFLLLFFYFFFTWKPTETEGMLNTKLLQLKKTTKPKIRTHKKLKILERLD